MIRDSKNGILALSLLSFSAFASPEATQPAALPTRTVLELHVKKFLSKEKVEYHEFRLIGGKVYHVSASGELVATNLPLITMDYKPDLNRTANRIITTKTFGNQNIIQTWVRSRDSWKMSGPPKIVGQISVPPTLPTRPKQSVTQTVTKTFAMTNPAQVKQNQADASTNDAIAFKNDAWAAKSAADAQDQTTTDAVH